MGLNIAPTFRVLANSQDITDKIADRLMSLRITDETGDTADTLEIVLADHDRARHVPVPPVGAELEAFIGFDGEVRRMGLYICDEIELSGFPGRMTIRARSAPFMASKGGKSDLQSQKTRTWKKGTTIGGLVKRIAGEHGMQPAVSAALASIALPALAQSRESDSNLLLRLAKQYDAVFKAGGERIVFVKRGEGSRASGEPMARTTLTPRDGGDYRVTIATRDDAGTTVAHYRDVRAAKYQEVSIGSGDPVLRLRMAYPDRVSAEAAAKSRHRERARASRTLAYRMPGRPEVGAETIVTMRGFRPGVDGEWLVRRAEHYIGTDTGYQTTIECEQPNSADAVRAASNVGATTAEPIGVEIA